MCGCLQQLTHASVGLPLGCVCLPVTSAHMGLYQGDCHCYCYEALVEHIVEGIVVVVVDEVGEFWAGSVLSSVVLTNFRFVVASGGTFVVSRLLIHFSQSDRWCGQCWCLVMSFPYFWLEYRLLSQEKDGAITCVLLYVYMLHVCGV